MFHTLLDKVFIPYARQDSIKGAGHRSDCLSKERHRPCRSERVVSVIVSVLFSSLVQSLFFSTIFTAVKPAGANRSHFSSDSAAKSRLSRGLFAVRTTLFRGQGIFPLGWLCEIHKAKNLGLFHRVFSLGTLPVCCCSSRLHCVAASPRRTKQRSQCGLPGIE